MAMPKKPDLLGALSSNIDLQKAEILFKGEINGPESFVWYNGALYSTIEDGFIKIINDKIVKKIKAGEIGCSSLPECGRPLGIRHYKNEKFFVADCYKGILEVDFETEKVTTILSGDTVIDGIKLNIADDLDFIDENAIIFSDASIDWDLPRFLNSMLELKGDGRIIKYNLKTKKAETLLSNLQIANGIQIHSDKQSVLICETSAARISRYYFDGPKKGIHEYFVTNLSGLPDNIRTTNNGTYYIAFAASRIPNHWSLIDFLAPFPFFRKLILQLIPDSLKFALFEATIAKYGIFVEVDKNGKYIQSWHDPSGFTNMLSQASDADDVIYVGSYSHDHLAKIYKNKA
uniref:Strictosidine synthase conserved region domain-containing protein n=1 Tax=Panagrolaimus superbus TaxID=310955 RepID=A0A914Z1A4_9BILA